MNKALIFVLLFNFCHENFAAFVRNTLIDRQNVARLGKAKSSGGRRVTEAIVLLQSSQIVTEAVDPFDGEVHSGFCENPSTVRDTSALDSNEVLMEHSIHMKPIGLIRSIYKLCVGTPRQGLLAPSARGYIDLFTLGNSSPANSVSGLQDFSHIWIMFVFHLNNQSTGSTKNVKSKIRPPALGGEKVGIYATRTPHRYNPIGMSLCKLERIETIDKRNVRLHVSGLDLVDGTPVLDIKPYVPVYDSVNVLCLPSWVEDGLSLRKQVTISMSAQNQLQEILMKDLNALDFFGPSCGDETIEDTMKAVLGCIRQVLSIDVRSSYQTEKTRLGRSQAERSSLLHDRIDCVGRNSSATKGCSQQIDNLLIHFTVAPVENPSSTVSENSGAEDAIVVTEIDRLLS